MNQMIRKRTELFLLAVLLLTCICPTGVATESTVSISPQNVTVLQGGTFTVDIVVDPAGNEVYSAECTLHFDNAMLKANNPSKGAFLSSDGAETVETLSGVNNGKIKYGETRRGGSEVVGGATESGVLASISFEALEQGTCDLTLEASLYDSGTHPISAVVANSGTCTVEELTGVTTTATEKPADSTASTATDEHSERPSTNNTIPGFGAFCSIAGLVVASLLASKGK